MKRHIVMIAGAIGLAACGQQHQASPLAEMSYRVGSPQTAGLMKVVAQPEIKICYTDATHSEERKEFITQAVLTWVDAVRDLSLDPLTSAVKFVASNAPCDATVIVGNYEPAQTYMGAKPTVYLNYRGWYGSSNIALHEFGHAFGLLDTYSGSGGACQLGQPDSVMCWARTNYLYEDDIQGARRVYRAVQAARAAGVDIVETKQLVE